MGYGNLAGRSQSSAWYRNELAHGCATGTLSPGEYIDEIKKAGELCYLAHPHWSLNRLATIQVLKGLDGAEVYNSVSVPLLNADRADSTHFLDLMARDGYLMPTLANDDCHRYEEEFAMSYNLVYADALTRESVLEALRTGRHYATQSSRFERVRLEGNRVVVDCSEVQHIMFYSNLAWNENRSTSGKAITHGEYPLALHRGESFVRVVLMDAQGKKAWLNPFSVIN